jgi:hypothetical protein
MSVEWSQVGLAAACNGGDRVELAVMKDRKTSIDVGQSAKSILSDGLFKNWKRNSAIGSIERQLFFAGGIPRFHVRVTSTGKFYLKAGGK